MGLSVVAIIAIVIAPVIVLIFLVNICWALKWRKICSKKKTAKPGNPSREVHWPNSWNNRSSGIENGVYPVAVMDTTINSDCPTDHSDHHCHSHHGIDGGYDCHTFSHDHDINHHASHSSSHVNHCHDSSTFHDSGYGGGHSSGGGGHSDGGGF